MQEWLTKFLKQEQAIPRPLYSLEQENELLHDMVKEIAMERNTYRIENQRLMDEIARIQRGIDFEEFWGRGMNGTEKNV